MRQFLFAIVLCFSAAACVGSSETRALSAAHRDSSNGRPIPPGIQQTTSTRVGDTAAVRAFVQGFYDWYVPIATGPAYAPGKHSGDMIASWALLSDERVGAGVKEVLRIDSIARSDSANSREILNGDPVLSSQDPCGPYKVAALRSKPGAIVATVVAACRGMEGSPYPAPRVDVDVVLIGDRYSISNFSFSGVDLISLVCGYAQNDPRREKRPAKCP